MVLSTRPPVIAAPAQLLETSRRIYVLSTLQGGKFEERNGVSHEVGLRKFYRCGTRLRACAESKFSEVFRHNFKTFGLIGWRNCKPIRRLVGHLTRFALSEKSAGKVCSLFESIRLKKRVTTRRCQRVCNEVVRRWTTLPEVHVVHEPYVVPARRGPPHTALHAVSRGDSLILPSHGLPHVGLNSPEEEERARSIDRAHLDQSDWFHSGVHRFRERMAQFSFHHPITGEDIQVHVPELPADLISIIGPSLPYIGDQDLAEYRRYSPDIITRNWTAEEQIKISRFTYQQYAEIRERFSLIKMILLNMPGYSIVGDDIVRTELVRHPGPSVQDVGIESGSTVYMVTAFRGGAL